MKLRNFFILFILGVITFFVLFHLMVLEFLQHGQNITNFFFLIFTFAILLFSLFSYFVLHKKILKRVESLMHQISQREDFAGDGPRIFIQGNDEIHDLSVSINGMLEYIDQSKQAIINKSKEMGRNERFINQLFNSIGAGVILIDPVAPHLTVV